jgi:hypothetical protein
MRPTRTMIMGYLVVLMLGVPSCVMLDGPISDPYQAEPDMKLFGSWRAVEEGGWVDQLIVGKYLPTDGTTVAGFPAELMRLEWIRFDKEAKPIETNVRLLCFPTRIADDRYLNVAIVSPENERKLLHSGWDEKLLVYAVFKYRVEGDKLTLQVMDLRGKTEVRPLGRIKGFARGLERFITLADTQRLVELLASEHAETYFQNEFVFTHMKAKEQPLAVIQAH